MIATNTNRIVKPHWLKSGLLCLMLAVAGPAIAVEIPDDPSQSIVYWKPHIISADRDPQVAEAEQIFNTLLRTWDGTRIAPALHVVKSSSGPWAASLADGNILLSVDALKTCLSFGKDRAPHLLAFVLSHEIAHQRSDDLWHQKFFRLIGHDQKKRLMRGLDSRWLQDVAEKEAQADHDAVLIMSSVGYDPFQIVDKNDFFTAWVEQIWRNSCDHISPGSDYYDACQQANTRRMRTQTQLRTLSDQTVIYQLGVQAFVAGNYAQARQLFTAYGRELPSRAVYTSIALSYLAQALKIPATPSKQANRSTSRLYFPLLLDSEPLEAIQVGDGKRGNDNEQQRLRREKIEQAIVYFDKAIKLNPTFRRSYLHLAMAYLMNANTFMSRGILQGQYLPRFGKDQSVTLLLALTDAVEGKRGTATRQLDRILKQLDSQTPEHNAIPDTLLRYAAARNLIALKAPATQANQIKIWKRLAQQANRVGDRGLFQLALQHLRPSHGNTLKLKQYPRIIDYRPGDKIDPNALKQGKSSEIWIEGDRHQVIRLQQRGIGVVIDAQRKISNVWQSGVSGQQLERLHIGDKAERIQQIFGSADRELYFSSGIYLAYDRYGIGIQVLNGQVNGWFLYGKQINTLSNG